MKDLKRLLAIKAKLKKRQPKYGRQETYLKRLDRDKWRTPRGLHIKVGERGHPAMLESGYRTPKAVRGMTKHGLYPILVAKVEQLESLDPKKQSIIVAKVGGKRRIELIEAATKKGITIVNASEKVAQRLKEQFKAHATTRKERIAKKNEKAQKAAAKLEEKVAKESAKGDAHAGHDHAGHDHAAHAHDHAHDSKEDAKEAKKKAKQHHEKI